MEAKLKAKELIDKYLKYVDWNDLIEDCTNRKWAVRNAKKCALIAVEEILESHFELHSWINKATYKYWVEVKEAIISTENES